MKTSSSCKSLAVCSLWDMLHMYHAFSEPIFEGKGGGGTLITYMCQLPKCGLIVDIICINTEFPSSFCTICSKTNYQICTHINNWKCWSWKKLWCIHLTTWDFYLNCIYLKTSNQKIMTYVGNYITTIIMHVYGYNHLFLTLKNTSIEVYENKTDRNE